MATLAEIQKKAQTLSETRDKLSALFITLESNIATVKNGSIGDIRRVARQVASQHNDLVDLIKANPELFAKPRSFIVEGIKFGLQASNGSLKWDDDAKVCERIERLATEGEISPEQAELLVVTERKPVANAMRQLEPKLLRRLGVTLEGAGDQPLIKSVDSSIEKAVTAVINAAVKEAQADA
ncbi:hypothetical protein [Variovorax sp.]|uniref:hypothetical protein n=1 Tax=Variovorax sp. TaxID=1871043 RepID=UPI003BAC3191